jgi:uncharacterized protein YbjT (DUF2867 family)
MHIVVFGGTGMVGQGVLRECLLAGDVERVSSVVRTPTRQHHAKLREIVHADFQDFSSLEAELANADACFFCLGVTSMGLSEEEYRRVTLNVTMAAAAMLERVNPQMTFCFVSATGTDSSEQGPVMWTRVKGAAENVVLRTFRHGYAFRPGVIQPLHGITSKTTAYRIGYALMRPLLPLLRRFVNHVTTTEQVGRAMLAVAREGYPKRILETADINLAA